MNFCPKKEEGSYKCWLVITFSQEVGYLGFFYIFLLLHDTKYQYQKKRKKEMSTLIINLYDY